MKLEPQLALVPMPACLICSSWAWATTWGQRSISCIWERLVLRRTKTSHMWTFSLG